MTRCILALDQGTTSSRAILFDQSFAVLASAAQEFPQHFPQSGWVEHDPEDIFNTTVSTARAALTRARIGAKDVVGLGITNQRETVVVWDRQTHKPIYNAIVWQDRRTSKTCASLKSAGHEPEVRKLTGLPLDPYFSAAKLAWILDHVPNALALATEGRLAAGTIDTYLLWRLTEGAVHATDATNASRTALYNIHEGAWDDHLLDLFAVPKSLLPDVFDCTHSYGTTAPDIFGAAIPVSGIAGDQQAATIGQACFKPGMVKSTYGTGCFALLNTGNQAVASKNNLLTTLAYKMDGETHYALEGSIYIAGAGVQWLRDGLQIIENANACDAMARAADATQDVVIVPAFVGLGAPYWNSDCRGAIFGLTRQTGRNELVRAILEAVCFQTADLIEAMAKDWPELNNMVLRVDGGMSASDWTMQQLADLLNCPVDRPDCLETTALGAAYLAGLQQGFYPTQDNFSRTWQVQKRFKPQMASETRQNRLALWRDAVRRTLS